MTTRNMLIRHLTPAFIALMVLSIFLSISNAINYQLAQIVPVIEGNINPVATQRQFFDFVQDKDGVTFRVKYYKNERCKIIGVNWYDDDTLYLPKVSAKPFPELLPHQTGWQDAGVWKLRLSTLDQTTASILSICDGDRLRISPFYPSDIKVN